MSSQPKEIVVTLDAKRLLVLGVIMVLSVSTLYSYIISLFAFIAPSQNLPLRITTASTFDTNDVLKSGFLKGETVRFNATVEMADYYYWYYLYSPIYYSFSGIQNYRIIFAVMDNNNRPVYFVSRTESISPGASEFTSYDWTIPSTASSGTYSIRVITWSDWLPTGVALAPNAREAMFTVS